MPLLKIQCSTAAPEKSVVEGLLTSLSRRLAEHLGKPESYVMTAYEPEIAMTFGGTSAPACYVEIKSIGKMSPQQTKAMSQDFCQEIESQLGIPKGRTYIEFADAQGSMWGWNGGTFG